MSFKVVQEGRCITVPREVEAEGAAAVDAFLADPPAGAVEVLGVEPPAEKTTTKKKAGEP